MGYKGMKTKMTKNIMAWLISLIMIMTYGVTALANESPDTEYGTDSSHILISEPDTSIQDVEALMLGDDPSVVLGDKSLAGYSTLAVFSVTAVGDYDFSEIETTEIRGASITPDMTVQIRFLPTIGAWEKLDFSVEDGAVLVGLPGEGQLAIFVEDDIEIDDAEDSDAADGHDDQDTGRAPQTGDRLPLYILVGLVSLAAFSLSVKKLRR